VLPFAAAQDVADFAGRTPDHRAAEWNDLARYARMRGFDAADALSRGA